MELDTKNKIAAVLLVVALIVTASASAWYFTQPAGSEVYPEITYSGSDEKYVFESSLKAVNYGWTVIDEKGQYHTPTTFTKSCVFNLLPGSYDVKLVLTLKDKTIVVNDWILITPSKIWSGFDKVQNGESITVSQNLDAKHGVWTVKEVFHTKYSQTNGVSTPYVGKMHYGDSVTISTPGIYEVTMVSSTAANITYKDYITIDGTFEKEFSWSYSMWDYGNSEDTSKKDFKVNVSYSLSDIRAAYDSPVVRCTDKFAESPVGITKLINPDGVAKIIESQLSSQFESAYGIPAEGQKYADFILAFVLSAIEYPPSILSNTDMYVYGVREYWAFPIQTIHLGIGDCDDTSILYASICAAAGFDTGIATKPGHAFAIVSVKDFKMPLNYNNREHMGYDYGDYVPISNLDKMYYACETHLDDFVLPIGFVNNFYDGTKLFYYSAA